MLTNAAAKAAGAQARAYKLFDGGGLFLHVAPTGTKSWRLKYRWRGREKLLVLGRFPALQVNAARIRAAEAKDKLERGIDPSAKRAADELATFTQVARAWHAVHRARWSDAHAGDVLASLELHAFPAIGERAIGAIGAAELVKLLEALEANGLVETAKRLRQRLRQIFAFAATRELVSSNPAAALGAALAGVAIATPHPALTAITGCRQLLAACEAAAARPWTRLASRFLALTAVRLEAVRGARWSEIDWHARTWTVPAARMKLARAKKGEARYDHVVPLSAAAIAVLEKAAELVADNKNGCPTRPESGLLFPGRGGTGPLAAGALRELYVRAGYAGRHVPHGWRASFSTIMNEEFGEEWRGAIDRALAHSPKDKVEAAYNRSGNGQVEIDRRRAIFERWGELLAP
jgi:integrase